MRAINTPGAPVPGVFKRRRRHKSKSGSNKSGSLAKLNGEWSARGRKQEDDQRGINNRARQQHIAEALAEIEEEREELSAEDAAWLKDFSREHEAEFWPMSDEYDLSFDYDTMWSDL